MREPQKGYNYCRRRFDKHIEHIPKSHTNGGGGGGGKAGAGGAAAGVGGDSNKGVIS